MASATCLRKNSWKSGAQKAALCRGSSMTAPAPHLRHFIWRSAGGAPARHHRAHFQLVAVAHDLVGRQEIGAADHEHGPRQDVELAEHVLDALAPGQLDLAARIAELDLHGVGKPRGGLDAAQLLEVIAVVPGLEHPPLGEVERAQRGCENVSGRGSTAPSRSMLWRLRSRAAFMSASSRAGLAALRPDPLGASAGPGGGVAIGVKPLRSAGNGLTASPRP